MFDIGQHLSEQRRRRGLTLEECEAATHIRGRYLMALEEDRPEDIPDGAYARLFLRGYATFLDLDADALVAEFDERRGEESPLDEHRVVPIELAPAGRLDEIRRWIVQPRRRSRRREITWLGAGLLGVLGVVVWMGARPGSSTSPGTVVPPVTRAAVPTARIAAPAPPPPPRATRLVLTGAGGGAWVRVLRGGSTGPLLFEGTMSPSSVKRFVVRRPLWMRVGSGPGLRVTLGGRAIALHPGVGDYLVTRTRVVTTR